MAALVHPHRSIAEPATKTVTQSSATNLLSMPPELRNQIYDLLFPTPSLAPSVSLPSIVSPNASLDYSSGSEDGADDRVPSRRQSRSAAIVQSCRQIHRETHLLYLSTTPFHLIGPVADPVAFAKLTSHLAADHKQHIRHIVLDARISHLRAMNENWNGLPFGDEQLHLDTLTLIPNRPNTHGHFYAEVADLSQSHTLAYVLAETLKNLRNVRLVLVRNEECFNEVIWRLMYRSLVYRLWKWSGRLCHLRFREDEDAQSFEVRIPPSLHDRDGTKGAVNVERWSDIRQELDRLMGTDSNSDAGGTAW